MLKSGSERTLDKRVITPSEETKWGSAKHESPILGSQAWKPSLYVFVRPLLLQEIVCK